MIWTAMKRTLCVAAVLGLAGIAPTAAQTGEVKIGLIAPMSGPWARQGDLMVKGANLAIENINQAGGIKSLGGAKLKLIVFDAGDSVEKAKNAAQRMIAQEPDLIGATGAWLSSFTLGVTEVTERAELPLLTLSYSDQITARGFKYVFQTSPTGGAQANSALPALIKLAESASGKKPKSVAIVMDNTAAPVSFAKPMREGGIEKLGLKLVVDETFTPPLSDATPLIQKVRSSRPDFLLLLPTAIPDDKMCLEKLHEFGLGRGRVPVISNGAHIGAPDMLKNLGKDLLEGVMTIVANWGAKGQEDIIKEFVSKTGEPWITQDSLSTYGDILILKDALETAGAADRRKVAEAIRKMDTADGPARYFPGGRVKFDENGRRVGADVVVVQWQSGVPVTVYPPASAVAEPIWPKS
ncbi:MAG TPA: ABC transporter substrate-binding protein [Hyphomicrobiaceae bacterium]|jgi:branched-chain amino acid transport system substrate-binding protein|nr:ABC transporter substrate-binding protein [Hyphomicrobiaceae bacterium]